jgi:hypothetical protein
LAILRRRYSSSPQAITRSGGWDQLVGFGDGLGPAADLAATRPQGSVLAGSSMTMAAWAAARATSRYVMLPANSRPVTSMMWSNAEYFTQPGVRG